MTNLDFLTQHPFILPVARNKAFGAIIGSALGDAIGLYTEFLPRSACDNAYPSRSFSLTEPATSFRGDGHRDKFAIGDWTDDTDQSLLICLSYLHSFENQTEQETKKADGGKGKELVVDPKDVAIRIHSWITQGLRCLDRPPLGIGATIAKVVLAPEYLSNPEESATRVWIKSKRNAAPNGSLMRTGCLGVMCLERSAEGCFKTATDVGRVTHVDPRCVVSTCLVTALIRGIIRGEILGEEGLDEMIKRAFEWVDEKEELKNPKMNEGVAGSEGNVAAGGDVVTPDDPAELESRLQWEEYRKHCYAETFRELQLDDSQKMGYVYKCLGTAVLSLRLAMRRQKEQPYETSEIFESIITELIMEGGDADTNACVAGALVGAWVGYDKLPPHWERGIMQREWLLKKTQAVVLRSGLAAPGELEKGVSSDPDTSLDGGKEFLSKKQLDQRESDFVFMVLNKQKDRREALEAEEKAKKGGIGKWFKKM